MCLAVPGRIVEMLEQEPPFVGGLVEFAGIRRKVNLTCAPAARTGDYVLVHAGIAITQIDEAEADRMLKELASIGLLAETTSEDEFLGADRPAW
jgi:hydrogenase expression/formation protein HypC